MDAFFAASLHTLIPHEDLFLITGKKVVLNNGYTRQVIDVYHL